jgi:hypothetical protein
MVFKGKSALALVSAGTDESGAGELSLFCFALKNASGIAKSRAKNKIDLRIVLIRLLDCSIESASHKYRNVNPA